MLSNIFPRAISFQYSNVQYTEMVRTLALCGDNVALACRTFNQRYGTRVVRRTMLAATQRLRDHGTFSPSTVIDRGANVLVFKMKSWTISIRIPMQVPEKQRHTLTVVICMCGEHFVVIKNTHSTSKLTPNDYEPRLQFSRWLLENWQRNIIWQTKVHSHAWGCTVNITHICGCTKILTHAEWNPSNTVSQLTSGPVLLVHTYWSQSSYQD